MNVSETTELAARCRELADRAVRAGTLPMESWGRALADGRGARQLYADTAALAWQLDRGIDAAADGTFADPPDAAARAARARRPVGVLTRELVECLSRTAVNLDRGTVIPDAREQLAEIERGLSEVGV